MIFELAHADCVEVLLIEKSSQRIGGLIIFFLVLI